GTLGGAIAAAAHRSDYSAAFLALGARVHTPGNELPYDAYLAQCGFDGAPPNMFVLGVSLPIEDHTAAYEKMSHPAAGYAECGVFASWYGSEARIAVISDTAPPFRWTALEAELRADDALAAIDDTPVHPLTDYAAELARALTRRALKTIA
ncbi:MAG: FAD binding domain-containing protein, partial [Pseudomonadota bacterium]